MKVWLLLVVLIGVSSCSHPSRGKLISEISFPEDIFKDAFHDIEEELQQRPNDIALAEQKIVYCEELDWPESCIDALTVKRNNSGLSSQLIKKFLDYHIKNGHHQRIVELIFRWDDSFGIKKEYFNAYIKALNELTIYDSLKVELPEYLLKNQSPKDHILAAKTYLAIGDTLLSIYYFSKIFNQGIITPDFQYLYPNLLFKTGNASRAFEAMETYLSAYPTDTSYALGISKRYEDSLKLQSARQVLEPYFKKDTIAFRIAELYKKEQKWDSAIYTLDKVINVDPSHRKALWRRARYYEDRGWLSYSLQFFEQMIQMDATDTSAIQRRNLINRKIAYLLRKKNEEEKLPIIELQPKKINIRNE